MGILLQVRLASLVAVFLLLVWSMLLVWSRQLGWRCGLDSSVWTSSLLQIQLWMFSLLVLSSAADVWWVVGVVCYGSLGWSRQFSCRSGLDSLVWAGFIASYGWSTAGLGQVLCTVAVVCC